MGSSQRTGKAQAGTPGMLLLALLLTVAGAQWAVALQHESLARLALEWEHPDAEAASRRLDRMADELTPWGQVDYSARLRPLLRFQGYPGEPDSGDLTARFGMSARIDFAERPATHARRVQAFQRARHELYRLRLLGVRDALLAHAKLLLAQEREARELGLLAEAEAALAAVADLAPATPSERSGLEAARLEQRKAALAYRRAQHELAQARRDAVAYGFAEAARYQPLRFTFPDADSAGMHPQDSHGRRMLELALLEAEAELDEARARPLDDLRLRGAYRTRAASVDIETGIVNGRPGATLGFSTPGGSERWQLQFSAEFVLDDSWQDLPVLEQSVVKARERVAAFAEPFRDDVQRALTEARLAEETLTLAEEEVALADLLLARKRLTLDELASASGSREAGPAPSERSLTRARRDVARSERAAAGARSRLYRAWTAYVRSVASLLETTGESWRILEGR